MITYVVYFRHNSEGSIGLGLELEMDCVSVGEDADVYEVIIANKHASALERKLDGAENVLHYEIPAERAEYASQLGIPG